MVCKVCINCTDSVLVCCTWWINLSPELESGKEFDQFIWRNRWRDQKSRSRSTAPATRRHFCIFLQVLPISWSGKKPPGIDFARSLPIRTVSRPNSLRFWIWIDLNPVYLDLGNHPWLLISPAIPARVLSIHEMAKPIPVLRDNFLVECSRYPLLLGTIPLRTQMDW